MKRINTSYACYFNNKYKRVGHVFQDRFKSECVESDGQLLSVIRYVHNNPVKANVVKQASKYEWSSYNLIALNNPRNIGIIERSEILEFFSPVEEKALKLFTEYSNKFADEEFLDIKEEKVAEINEENALEYIEKYLKENKITRESLRDDKDAKHRNFLIKEVKEKSNLSIRKIAELLNVNRGIVQRICVSKEPSL
jgi:putative transposase